VNATAGAGYVSCDDSTEKAGDDGRPLAPLIIARSQAGTPPFSSDENGDGLLIPLTCREGVQLVDRQEFGELQWCNVHELAV